MGEHLQLLLPATTGFLRVQVTLLLPAFILAVAIIAVVLGVNLLTRAGSEGGALGLVSALARRRDA